MCVCVCVCYVVEAVSDPLFHSPYHTATKYGCPFAALRAEFAAVMPLFLVNEYRSSQVCARCGGWCGLVGWSKRTHGRQTASNGARHLCPHCDPFNPRAMHKHGPSKDVTACENIFRRGYSLLLTGEVPASLRRPEAPLPARDAADVQRHKEHNRRDATEKGRKRQARAAAKQPKMDERAETSAALVGRGRRGRKDAPKGSVTLASALDHPAVLATGAASSRKRASSRLLSEPDGAVGNEGSSDQGASNAPGTMTSARGLRVQKRKAPQERKQSSSSESDESGDSSASARGPAPTVLHVRLPKQKTLGMPHPPPTAAPHPLPIQGAQSPEALHARVADMDCQGSSDQDDSIAARTPPPSVRGSTRGSLRGRGTQIGMRRMRISLAGGRAAAAPAMHGDHPLQDLDNSSEPAAPSSPTA